MGLEDKWWFNPQTFWQRFWGDMVFFALCDVGWAIIGLASGTFEWLDITIGLACSVVLALLFATIETGWHKHKRKDTKLPPPSIKH